MTNTTKMADRSVVASCLLGSVSLRGTGLSAIAADSPALAAALPVRERNERPTQAPVAVLAAEAQAHGAYGFAAAAGAASAGFKTQQTKQTTKQQHHLMWAFRGLEPWSDPV
ncbi:hypothetical protein [Streptomyces sp. ISL-94]|uniref:hypothetical protein n=1 Tax=Streptomyces sp. ISL-94 TaxID=2819190 RepID=UPI001BE8C79D|nr:hypothetical protein [Streptomyces sp. ISL-94]MBT2478197.1 hypothetical protein [Streptomyces sp. ISL-94]